MDIADVYEKFDQIGCVTFATIDKDTPQTRIAHLFAHDHEGLYFRTMITRAFYKQLKKTGKVSICGMYPKTPIGHKDQGTPYVAQGYTIRATGDIKEVSSDKLKEKAATNEIFILGVRDSERYPAMATFCLYSAWGELFDFDLEMEYRSHKILRTGFCFGGKHIPLRGVRITEKCNACGDCQEKCSFKAIYKHDERLIIDQTICDLCGDCYMICPTNAVEIVIDDPKNRPSI